MKVILIRDVARIGKKGAVCDVPDGHAQNFLIPRKLAIPATDINLRRHQEGVRQHDTQKGRAEDAFRAACTRLASEQVIIHVDANAQGHLFKGVRADDIVAQMEVMGMHIDTSSLKLPHPIKELGTCTVPLSFAGITGTATVVVVKK